MRGRGERWWWREPWVEGWLEREGRTHDIIPSASLRGQSFWLLQVRTAAAAEGATPPAVPRRVPSNLRSWGGFKIKNWKKQQQQQQFFNPAEETREPFLDWTCRRDAHKPRGLLLCFNHEDVRVYKLGRKKEELRGWQKRKKVGTLPSLLLLDSVRLLLSSR